MDRYKEYRAEHFHTTDPGLSSLYIAHRCNNSPVFINPFRYWVLQEYNLFTPPPPSPTHYSQSEYLHVSDVYVLFLRCGTYVEMHLIVLLSCLHITVCYFVHGSASRLRHDCCRGKRMSKVRTLQHAIEYISGLLILLQHHHQPWVSE